VQGSCVQASLPSSSPDSGIQQPVCYKVDDPSTLYLRFNIDKAKEAASAFCASLISRGVVLDAQHTTISPYIVSGAAENNGSLALTVLFDVDSCPTDKSMQSVDFAKLGQTECENDLFVAISEVCAQDSTWGDFNPDYTVEGGVFANDCGLWSMGGQPA
jgi:hypothetical protein